MGNQQNNSFNPHYRQQPAEQYSYTSPPQQAYRGNTAFIPFDVEMQNSEYAKQSNFYKLFQRFSFKSSIFVLTIIQILVYIVQLVQYHKQKKISSNENMAWNCVIHSLGAKDLARIQSGQIWRLVTPIFLHANLMHIFSNLLTQNLFGYLLEHYYSTPKMLIIYLLSGISGNLLSCIMKPDTLGIGASTSVFGIMALMLCYYYENYHKMGENRKSYVGWYLAIVTLNFLIPLFDSNSNVDMGGHIGGFIFGGLAGMILVRKSELKTLKGLILVVIMAIYFSGTFITTFLIKSYKFHVSCN